MRQFFYFVRKHGGFEMHQLKNSTHACLKEMEVQTQYLQLLLNVIV